MKKSIYFLTIAISSLLIFNFQVQAKYLSDAQIKRILIQESIASYSGNCPCPYNTASNGSSCGGRSAYSRAGGYSPLCYPSDVTKEMIREYRSNHK